MAYAYDIGLPSKVYNTTIQRGYSRSRYIEREITYSVVFVTVCALVLVVAVIVVVVDVCVVAVVVHLVVVVVVNVDGHGSLSLVKPGHVTSYLWHMKMEDTFELVVI
jgi:hypothetical protein